MTTQGSIEYAQLHTFAYIFCPYSSDLRRAHYAVGEILISSNTASLDLSYTEMFGRVNFYASTAAVCLRIESALLRNWHNRVDLGSGHSPLALHCRVVPVCTWPFSS